MLGRGHWHRAGAPPVPAPRCLSLLHRCVVLYLTLPVFVWLLGWFEWWFGVSAALLLAAAIGPMLRGSWRIPRPRPRTLAIVAAALGWTMLTAHGGVFDGNNPDWPDRRAMLLDLTRHSWPTRLTDDLAAHLPWGGGERQALLRYYLAWYMVPGLAGRVFGPAALNWAVPAWTGLGVALMLLLFARGLRGRHAVLAVGVFILFGGLDPLRNLLQGGIGHLGLRFDTLGSYGFELPYSELAGLKGMMTLYFSNTAALRMAPHLIPAALYALLLAQLCRHPRFVAGSGVVLAAAPFWSLFVAMGLLPFVVALVWENGLRRRSALWSWSNLCLAAPLVALFALYLSAGALDFGHGWLWEVHDWRRLRKWAPLFYGSECVPHLLLVLALRPRLARRPVFIACAMTLLLLPWYRAGGHNLTWQGVHPALVLLCHYCVRALCRGPGTRLDASTTIVRRGAWRLAFGSLVFVLAVGAVGAVYSLAPSVRNMVPFSFARSGSTMFAIHPEQQRENLAAEARPLLAALLTKAEGGVAKRPGAPVFRADFDAYALSSAAADGHTAVVRLVLVKERCDHDDRFLRVTFVPTNRHSDAEVAPLLVPRWYGGGCGAVLALPGWPVDSVRVGQLPADGGDWAMEVLFDAAGRIAGVMPAPPCWYRTSLAGVFRDLCPANPGVAALRGAYERAQAATPVVESVFNVHLTGRRLVYVRAPCVLADVEARFSLHLTPDDPRDLPPQRLRHGFVNWDFAFATHGGVLGDVCVAVVRLPAWPVRELRTGQFHPHGPVWRETVRLDALRGGR